MNKETKKAALITVLTTSAFLLAIIPVLDFILYAPGKDGGTRFSDLLITIRFYLWNPFVIFCLAGYALKEVRTWKIASGCLYPKVITVIILSMALLLAALCFFIKFMFELPT